PARRLRDLPRPHPRRSAARGGHRRSGRLWPMTAYAVCPLAAEEREKLILEHLPQVHWIASRLQEKLPATINIEDLVSAGVIGLISAIDHYDPSHGASLRTYAEYKIRGAILDSIRGLDGIPVHKRKRVRQVAAAISALEQRLQRAPAEEEIAMELSLGLAEYQQWLHDIRGVSLGSLE